MPQPWHPEHAVDADLARALVTATWPDLAHETVERVGSGWDIDVWRFGDVAVRFPRRAAGIGCLDRELALLPAIADRVPLPVPRPLAIGAPALGYPSRFYAHAYLPGAPANRAGLDDGELARLARPLGRFLAALHAIALPDAPIDTRGGPARIAERGRSRLDACGLAPELHARAAALLATPPPESPDTVLTHGDLHAGNVLVDRDGAVAAVIDWGDCARGDPAIDLAIGWSAIPPGARGDFLAAYGDVAPATWARARLSALSRQGIALCAWGLDVGDARVVEFARASIARTLS